MLAHHGGNAARHCLPLCRLGRRDQCLDAMGEQLKPALHRVGINPQFFMTGDHCARARLSHLATHHTPLEVDDKLLVARPVVNGCKVRGQGLISENNFIEMLHHRDNLLVANLLT